MTRDATGPRSLDDPRFYAANDLILEERLDEALALLDEVASDAATDGNDELQGRALRLAAALARLVGDLNGAVQRGRRGVKLPRVGRETRTLLAAELGEHELLAGRPWGAVRTYSWLLELVPPLQPAQRCAVLRKLATALLQADRPADAGAALDQATRLAREADEPIAESRLLVEAATLRFTAGDSAAGSVARVARRRAEESGDAASLADLAMLDAARALQEGDPSAALDAVEEARRRSLDAVAPMSYLGAALTVARLADLLGDRHRAYESLAKGWVTLADLLGDEVAEQVFAPELRRLRDVWGIEAFTEVKEHHDERRRRVLAAERPPSAPDGRP